MNAVDVRPTDDSMRRVVYAADQPQYNPLPALVEPDGTIHTRWQLTDAERADIAAGGDITLAVMTFHQPLQPLLLGVALDR